MSVMKNFLTVFFCLAVAVAAQDLPEGPSAADIQIVEETEDIPVPVAADTNKTQTAGRRFLVDAGIQYAEEGEYEEAERAYLRALENNPGDEDIQFRLSTLYISMQRYQKAVDILEALSEKFPDNAQVHNNLSWAYSTGQDVRNSKLALRHARDAILIYPNSPSMWNTLAEAYYVFGDYERALRTSEHAIDLLQNQDASEEQLLVFQNQRDRIIRAEEAYKRLFNLDDE